MNFKWKVKSFGTKCYIYISTFFIVQKSTHFKILTSNQTTCSKLLTIFTSIYLNPWAYLHIKPANPIHSNQIPSTFQSYLTFIYSPRAINFHSISKINVTLRALNNITKEQKYIVSPYPVITNVYVSLLHLSK